MVDADTTITTAPGVPYYVPLGTYVYSVNPSEQEGMLAVAVHIAYDYEPFFDGNAPAFEFQADELIAHDADRYTLTENITCISTPDGTGGRITTRKEQN
ncbi:hypothetical protein EF294_15755 [Gordonia oryzae]|uniref:DUF7233 domain-containing protein n=2 Tax=Gordonia oryzae TaxID=2487349 RepID=A0A3N4GIY9_9ACTN|nr:hypothetical protein EF294_15755 [Gordonia oryzae]